MEDAIQITTTTRLGQPRPLGFLMQPMDWAARALFERAGDCSPAAARLLEIGKARMHVIAIALAHDPAGSLPVHHLLHARLSEILDQALAPKPAGLRGVINRLPAWVLQPTSYQGLVGLMRDPRLADALAHGYGLDDRALAALADVPVPLRRTVLALLEDQIGLAAGLTDGLRWLADRGAGASYNALVADLSVRQQPAQLLARVRRLVEALPLPEQGPPARVGPADRIDAPDPIRRIAKAWQNCLADYLEDIEEGRCAVYHWPAPPSPIIVMVQRHGRLGWFLEQVRGPRNGRLASGPEAVVEAAFIGIGIPPVKLIEPIEAILSRVESERRRRA